MGASPSRAMAMPARCLTVQRLVLTELSMDDRRQQLRTGAATVDWIEWRRRLCDRLARAAGEFLPHRLDHLVATRNALQAFADGLAKLHQLATAARAACG